MIIKTNLVPDGFGAITMWPFILMRPQVAEDAGLVEHEMVHYREQSWITPWWGLKYFCSKNFRQAAEVRAYKRQIEVGGITLANAARAMLRYDLDIDFDDAYDLLK